CRCSTCTCTSKTLAGPPMGPAPDTPNSRKGQDNDDLHRKLPPRGPGRQVGGACPHRPHQSRLGPSPEEGVLRRPAERRNPRPQGRLKAPRSWPFHPTNPPGPGFKSPLRTCHPCVCLAAYTERLTS